MKKNFLYSLMLLFLFISCSKQDEGTQLPYDYSQEQQIDLTELLAKAEWKKKEVSAGVVWKYFQFPQIFESKQYINIFEIDLSKGFQIEIPYVTSGFLKTSDAAAAKDALVAFNGSFFNTTTGGSTVFFKNGGQLVNQTINGFTAYRENGAVVLDNAGLPSVVAKPSGGWTALAQPVALAGGPLLIMDSKQLSQLEVDFNNTRHPRTAVGITADNKMLVVVVDGRSSQSQGLTIPQLSELMAGLGCTQALNLDGGGSSTAWVKGEGIVNFPSDNGKFDHEGERAVATVFTVKNK
ncbi:phosphodiester glycosidase family protein [Sphingobacterium olei]|uniref:Phosphodiester glycosidase family protein n=1 Tax=Sphingobacterium olei TaxID=2571155 RepID=A0A4V5MMI3_9SPHI|nr:phosphodiester glycosidase family protein [Sphingobacterium olei]TJZ61048.1 phosphodiester glycosidase family protein [Sphingobacterium olei]